jgi:hypothetical protein
MTRPVRAMLAASLRSMLRHPRSTVEALLVMLLPRRWRP